MPPAESAKGFGELAEPRRLGFSEDSMFSSVPFLKLSLRYLSGYLESLDCPPPQVI